MDGYSREWHWNGKVIEGEAVLLKDDMLTIERNTGGRLIAKLTEFSIADREYVMQHRAALSRGERPTPEVPAQSPPPTRPPSTQSPPPTLPPSIMPPALQPRVDWPPPVSSPAVPAPGVDLPPMPPGMPESRPPEEALDGEASISGSSVDDLYRQLLAEVETLFPRTDYGTVKVIAVSAVFVVLFGALLIWALATEIVLALFKEATNGFAWSLLMGFLVVVVTWLISVASSSVYAAAIGTQRWLSLALVLLLTWLVLAAMAKVDVLKALPMAVAQFLIFCLGVVCMVLLLFGILLITVDLVGSKEAWLPGLLLAPAQSWNGRRAV